MNFSASSDYIGNGSLVQHAVIERNISKLTFEREDTVLDVGCGPGNETKWIATKVTSITGMDLSEEMIEVARAKSSAPNITYCVGDALTIADNPELRNRFDKVVCFNVLQWIDDKPKALRSILTCLKPGGEAFFIVGNRTLVLNDATVYLNGHPKWGDYVKDYDVKLRFLNQSSAETEELMTSSGWTNLCCEIDEDVSSISELQTKLLFKTVLGQTARIPKAELEEFLDDLWQWVLTHFEDPSHPGLFKTHSEFMVINASK